MIYRVRKFMYYTVDRSCLYALLATAIPIGYLKMDQIAVITHLCCFPSERLIAATLGVAFITLSTVVAVLGSRYRHLVVILRVLGVVVF